MIYAFIKTTLGNHLEFPVYYYFYRLCDNRLCVGDAVESGLHVGRDNERRLWILVYARSLAVDFPVVSGTFGEHRVSIRAIQILLGF